MKEKFNSGVDANEWATWAEAKWGLPAYRLKKIMAAHGQWQIRVDELSGVKKTTRRPPGRGKCVGGLSQANVGCRQVGGGRTNLFKHINLRVKRWLAVQRSNCHPVESMELVEVFRDELTAEIEAAEAELKKRSLSAVTNEKFLLRSVKPSQLNSEEVPEMATEVVATDYDSLEEVTRVKLMTEQELTQWLDKMMERQSNLSKDEYKKSFVRTLVQSIEGTGSLPKPSRLINMSDEDAAMRVQLGWKLWDHKLWTAAFATASQLQNLVQPVAPFEENRKNMVIGQSDQLEIWIRIWPGEEQKTTKKRKQPEGVDEGQVSAAPFLPEKETEGKATPEMFRVTYEARQVIHNYFD